MASIGGGRPGLQRRLCRVGRALERDQFFFNGGVVGGRQPVIGVAAAAKQEVLEQRVLDFVIGQVRVLRRHPGGGFVRGVTDADGAALRARPGAGVLTRRGAGCGAARLFAGAGGRLQHPVAGGPHLGQFQLIDQPFVDAFEFASQGLAKVFDPQRADRGRDRRGQQQGAQCLRIHLGPHRVGLRADVDQPLRRTHQAVEFGQHLLDHGRDLLQQPRGLDAFLDLGVIDQREHVVARQRRHRGARRDRLRSRFCGLVEGGQQGPGVLRTPAVAVAQQFAPGQCEVVALGDFQALCLCQLQRRHRVVDRAFKRRPGGLGSLLQTAE